MTLSAYTCGQDYDSLQWWHDDAPIPGETEPQLVLANATAAASGNYRLAVDTANGLLQSVNTITLNVLPAPPTPVDPAFAPALPDCKWVQTVTPVPGSMDIIVSYLDHDEQSHTLHLAADGSGGHTLVFSGRRRPRPRRLPRRQHAGRPSLVPPRSGRDSQQPPSPRRL